MEEKFQYRVYGVFLLAASLLMMYTLGTNELSEYENNVLILMSLIFAGGGIQYFIASWGFSLLASFIALLLGILTVMLFNYLIGSAPYGEESTICTIGVIPIPMQYCEKLFGGMLTIINYVFIPVLIVHALWLSIKFIRG